MPYCVKCGVEIDEQESKCPLCGTPVYNPDAQAVKTEKARPSKADRATVRYIKNKYSNITGFCIFSIMLILFIINVSVSGNISWSKFALSSLALLWFLMVFPVKSAGRLNPVFIVSVCLLASSVFIVYLDYLTVFEGWSMYPLLSAFLAAFGISFPVKFNKMKAVNIISVISSAAAVYIILLDFISDFKGWSLYVAGAMALAWAFSLLPFYITKKYSFIGAIFFDSLLVLAYLFFVMASGGHTDKFLSFALPIVACVSLPLMLTYVIYKYFKFSAYGILSAVFLFAGLVSLAADYILNRNIFRDGLLFHEWSLITAICCCAVISPLLFIIEKNKKLQNFLSKNFNI